MIPLFDRDSLPRSDERRPFALSRSAAETRYNVARWTDMPRGCRHAELSEADLVAIWLTVRGIQHGVWRGIPPAGGELALRAMNLFRFSDGLIAEVYASFNVADYIEQLSGRRALGRQISSDEQDPPEAAGRAAANDF